MFTNAYKSTTAKLAGILGLVLVLVGILGFFNNPVLGIFRVDTIHNLIHLGSGLFLLLYGGQNSATARNAFLGLGLIYLVVTALGFVQVTEDPDNLLGFIAMNPADNYLHAALTAVFLTLGLKKAEDLSDRPATSDAAM
jgi:hypothetical protein